MSTQENAQIVKDAFAAVGRGDKQGLLALSAEDVEWIVPGEERPLTGTHHGHAGLADLFPKTFEIVETSFPEPPEFVPHGDGFCSSASVGGESKPRKKRSRTILSSPSLFEMPN
jgi:hypothetical protein